MKKTARSQLGLVKVALFLFHHHEGFIPVTAKTGLLPMLKLKIGLISSMCPRENIQSETTK